MVKRLIQYLNGILMTLKLIYQIKATQGITGLIYWIAHIKWMVWHLDVGLSFPKSVSSLIVGSAHPILSNIFGDISWIILKTHHMLDISNKSHFKQLKTALSSKTHHILTKSSFSMQIATYPSHFHINPTLMHKTHVRNTPCRLGQIYLDLTKPFKGGYSKLWRVVN